MKHGNMEHTVVPNVPLWNDGFQWMLIVLSNVFSCKESSTREQCILIRELFYTNPRLQQKRLQHYTRNRCELATTQFGCWCFSHATSEQTELLLLISRPPLRWLVTHKEQNSTQPPVLLKNTIARLNLSTLHSRRREMILCSSLMFLRTELVPFPFWILLIYVYLYR
jgi:hypothetical protein